MEDDETNLTFEGPFAWQGESFDLYRRIERNTGYIDEYTSKEIFCTSNLLIPGMELMNQYVLTAFYFFALVYLFMGIAIVSDIFMEAIEMITSQT